MKPQTQTWIGIAERHNAILDEYLALKAAYYAEGDRTHRRQPAPYCDMECTLAYGVVKYYLFALLQEVVGVYKVVSDNRQLLNQLLDAAPQWNNLREPVSQSYSFINVDPRLRHTITQEDALEAVRLCHIVRDAIRPSLGLPL